jgi:hypothetical protein
MPASPRPATHHPAAQVCAPARRAYFTLPPAACPTCTDPRADELINANLTLDAPWSISPTISFLPGKPEQQVVARLSFSVNTTSGSAVLLVTSQGTASALVAIWDFSATEVREGARGARQGRRLHPRPCLGRPTLKAGRATFSARPRAILKRCRNLAHPAAQVVALGTCIDSAACSSLSTCGAWGGTSLSADNAWASARFSSASAVFANGGPYHVLVRVGNPNGCNSLTSDCFNSVRVSYRLLTCGWSSARPPGRLAAPCACCVSRLAAARATGGHSCRSCCQRPASS